MANALRDHCDLLIRSITKEAYDKFEKAKSDFRRISVLYEVAKNVPFDFKGPPPKHFKDADNQRVAGNKCFKDFIYDEALNKYNLGLESCPQDTDEGQELYNILLGNRSATFFQLGKHKAVVEDIKLLKLYKKHPNWGKVYRRGAKSYEYLGLYKEANKYYQLAINYIKEYVSKNEKLIQELEKNILDNQGKKSIEKTKDKTFMIPKLETVNKSYPSLSSNLTVQENSEFGRFVVATSDIPAGKIIAVEKPFVAVVSTENFKSNCHFCSKSIYQFLVCPNCSTVRFCCQFCLKSSKHFHDVECYLLPALKDYGVSVNGLMALRIITQQTLEDIRKKKLNHDQNQSDEIYQSDNIFNVYRLAKNENSRSIKEFVHLTFMAIFFLRMLKRTTFFEPDAIDSVLTEEEAYVGSLILKNLQILQFNAHELSELRNVKNNDDKQTFQADNLGAGLYPTLAFFNHSCDPSITRYNVGTLMVYCAIKPIHKDEQVFENYGHLFQHEGKKARQESLLNWYHFKCSCVACQEDWPLYESTKFTNNEHLYKCKCPKKSKELNLVYPINCKNCDSLNRANGIMIKGQEGTVKRLIRTEGPTTTTIEEISKLLDYYSTFLEQPAYPMLVMQQNLRAILLHFGSKQCEYEYPHKFF